MTKHLFLVVASVAALSACNSRDNNNDSAGNTASSNASASAGTSGSASGGTNSSAPAGDTAQLEQEMAQAVQMLRPQLPIRQQTPGGTLTISNIEARGTELVYTMEVPTDMTEASFEQFKNALPQQACANPQARALFERGGSYTYNLKDSGGEEFTTSIRGC